MSWRCAWCWAMNLSDKAINCPRCGRDIMVYEREKK